MEAQPPLEPDNPLMRRKKTPEELAKEAEEADLDELTSELHSFIFLQVLCNVVHFAINGIDFSLSRTEKHAGDSGERVEDSDREQVRGAVKYFTLHLMMHLNKPSPCPTLDLYSHYLRTLNKNTETSPFLWTEKKNKSSYPV